MWDAHARRRELMLREIDAALKQRNVAALCLVSDELKQAFEDILCAGFIKRYIRVSKVAILVWALDQKFYDPNRVID